LGKQVKAKVDQWEGITWVWALATNLKTQAKLANNAAKKYPATGSVGGFDGFRSAKTLVALVM